MKRFLLTSVAIVLTAGAATAADMSVPFKAAPAYAPYYSWTGCYLGIHGGGKAMRDAVVGTVEAGGVFGGQLGCNYQIDHLVLGFEGEAAWNGVDATLTNVAVPAAGLVAGSFTGTFKSKWDADVAVRFGLAYDRFLIYEKVGVSWADSSTTAATVLGGVAPVGSNFVSGSTTLTGLLWGVGIEYGLAPQWTAKFETDFTYYPAANVNNTCSFAAPGTCVGTLSTTSQNALGVAAKIGINYKFW
jgi:outer membrane immunogenic protein